jgi:SAM-dependent methyltransferase
MVAQAQKQSSAPEYSNISFRQAEAENLSFVEDGSVDMVVSGQAAHWFDHEKSWPEIHRVLRKGGTVAYWCYKDFVFVDYPKASAIFLDYAYSMPKNKLGSYWEPGRKIVRELYRPIVPPKDLFEDEQRIEYEPGTQGIESGQGTRLMSRKMTVKESMGYLWTFSSVHSWLADHGNPKSRAEGGNGDIVDEMYDKMREAEGWDNDDLELELEWGSSVILARKT